MDERDESAWVLLAGGQADNATLRAAVEAEGYAWRALPPGPVDDELLAGAVGAVVPAARPLTADEVRRAPRLRAVVSPVIGTEHLPLDLLAERGIPVAHGAFPENYLGMAEAAVGLIVSLVHRVKEKETALVAGTRPPGVGGLVGGRTVGLVGLGRIGAAITERLAPFGCRMVSTASAAGRTPGVEAVTMDELLDVSDVISVQVPLTPATRGLIGAAEIRAMRPGAALVSIGRGGVVDEDALAAALDSGHLGGAAIDVWEQEPPPPDHPLLRRADVIATMHNVGHSEESYRRMAELSGEQLLDLLAGREPVFPVPGA